jgi:xanthine dehydrogenase accessory factor
VSGGCVEAAVIEEGLEVLRTGQPKLLRYGVADETAFEVVGLACGGSIEVFVRALREPELRARSAAIDEDRASATAIVIDGVSGVVGETAQIFDDGSAWFDCMPEREGLLEELARRSLRGGRSERSELDDDEAGAAFVDVQLPAPQLIIVGAVHIAQALVKLAAQMNFRVTVIDPRSAFASAERFPSVDSLVVAQPREALAGLTITRSTAIVTLTHDARFDEPALAAALHSDAFYIGALGGRSTSARRRERMSALGFDASDLDRIAAPIGLDIGARSPEEIALATMAQIVAARNSR